MFYRFTRSLTRRLNRALHRLGVGPLFLLAACSQCNLPPPVPNEPTSTTGDTTSISTTGSPTIEQQCADVCESYRERDCVEADSVCPKDGFDETLECAKPMLTCEKACTETPDYYLSGECEAR